MDYDENALTAKQQFLEDLGNCASVVNRRGKLRVNYIAELIGMSPPSVSRFLRNHERISENFIRQITLHVPGMELAYAKFRITADEGFIPYTLYETSRAKQAQLVEVDTAMARFAELVDAQRATVLAKVSAAVGPASVGEA